MRPNWSTHLLDGFIYWSTLVDSSNLSQVNQLKANPFCSPPSQQPQPVQSQPIEGDLTYPLTSCSEVCVCKPQFVSGQPIKRDLTYPLTSCSKLCMCKPQFVNQSSKTSPTHSPPALTCAWLHPCWQPQSHPAWLWPQDSRGCRGNHSPAAGTGQTSPSSWTSHLQGKRPPQPHKAAAWRGKQIITQTPATEVNVLSVLFTGQSHHNYHCLRSSHLNLLRIFFFFCDPRAFLKVKKKTSFKNPHLFDRTHLFSFSQTGLFTQTNMKGKLTFFTQWHMQEELAF